MLYKSKTVKTMLLLSGVLMALLGGLLFVPPRTVQAADAGTCFINTISGNNESNSTQPCANIGLRFGAAAQDAASANKCYTVLVASKTSLSNATCGGSPAGTCFVNTISGTGESNSTRACNSITSRFGTAATDAAAASKCYIILVGSKTSLSPTNCNNSGSSTAATCNDGTHIPARDLSAGTEAQYCASRGGYNPPGGTGGGGSGGGGTTDDPDATGSSDRPPGIEEAADTAFGGCSQSTGDGTEQDACGFVDKYLNPAINFLAAATGMVVVIMIIIGGIQYASAGGEAGKVAAAKGRIFNAIFALVAFLFLYAILQWIVPGGLF